MAKLSQSKWHYIASPIYATVYLNSAINPFLYAYLNRSLRQAYNHSKLNASRKLTAAIPDNQYDGNTNSNIFDRVRSSLNVGNSSVRTRLLTVTSTNSAGNITRHRHSASSQGGGSQRSRLLSVNKNPTFYLSVESNEEIRRSSCNDRLLIPVIDIEEESVL
jgi:hypothetical protein